MEHQRVRMDFTPQELGFLLGKKKICPECGGRMDRSKESETRYGSEFQSARGVFPGDHEQVDYYSYVFTCRDCGRKYSLSELANRQ